MRGPIGKISLALVAALFLPSCTLPFGIGSAERTILVDYKHDEFSGSFLDFFPDDVTVRPGDTVAFKQFWSGEPHSVTMGTIVDQAFAPLLPILEQCHAGACPKEPPPQAKPFFDGTLPTTLGEDNKVHQNGAQPCYLDTGAPPKETDKACPKVKQPAFNGRQTYYSSGFIPYEGPAGNTFKVKIADNTAPGTYHFYCNIHGPLMSGSIVVKDKGAQIPSQAEVNKQAQAEIDKEAKPLLKALNEAKAGKALIKGNLAGYRSPDVMEAFIAEFIPKRIEARVGEKVTWLFVGRHTVSFNVPKYFPYFTVERDGTVRLNPQAVEAVGGPAAPTGPPPPGSPKPVIIDAGAWDGSRFLSSGLSGRGMGDFGYSITFTKPGTYQYACLIHPQQVGEVVVR